MRDLGITPQSSAVVSAIIALARSLGLRVIAEGVENLRQMDVLHRLGCGVMQGFLFAKALPPDDLETWLQQTVLPRKAPWIGTASDEAAAARARACLAARADGRARERPDAPSRPSRTAAAPGWSGRRAAHAGPNPGRAACQGDLAPAGAGAAGADARELRARLGPWRPVPRRRPSRQPPASRRSAMGRLIERLVRGLERGGRQWTAARKKDGLQRVLDGSRADPQRLHERLRQLTASWDGDDDAGGVETLAGDLSEPHCRGAARRAAGCRVPATRHWGAVVASLEGTVRTALPADDARARDLADQLAALARAHRRRRRRARRWWPRSSAPAPRRGACWRSATSWSIELAALARELTAGLTELAEDDSWARGQAEAMQARLGPADGSAVLSVRSVRATHDLLAQTRRQQQRLQGRARPRARCVEDAGAQPGRPNSASSVAVPAASAHSSARYAESIEQADSLDGLADAGARDGAAEPHRAGRSRQTPARACRPARPKPTQLSTRVRELEGELRRLSEEVSIDALTQVANRRGLAQAFEAESARHAARRQHAGAWR